MEMTKWTHVIMKSGKNKIEYNPFEWIEVCKKAFQDLKQAFIITPVLAYFNSELKTLIESNFSDFETANIFLQVHKRVLRPVAYFSKKLTPVECNYMIYNKELLAIVKSFEMWHLKLVSTAKPVKVYTDYRNLGYFMMIKQLNRQQVR